MNHDDSMKEPSKAIQLPCPTCSKLFWTRAKLNRHIIRVHEKRYTEKKREKKYKCTFEGCGKAYTTPGKLRDHSTSHTGNFSILYHILCGFLGEKPFECGRCDKKFGGRELFGRHLRDYHAISIKDVEKMLNI
jgi:uncharacterized C2H2 Zn-finger protein